MLTFPTSYDRPRAVSASRRIPALAASAAAVLTLTACGDLQPTAPETAAAVSGQASARSPNKTGPGQEPLKVLSRNVYLGGDIGPLFGVDFTDFDAVAAAAGQIWATVQSTDFPTRAAALAAEIGRSEPHVVGLQEVSRFLVSPSPGFPPPATLTLDFAQILMDALAGEGVAYDLVEVVDNTRVVLPAVTPGGLVFVDFTDRDAVLVRSDVEYSGVSEGNYGADFTLGPVMLKRGWIRLDVAHRGVDYHVLNTHLEVQGLAPVQAGQLLELRQMLAGVQAPTVLMGDLNSDAAAEPGDPSWTPTYETLVAAGWVDAWLQAVGPTRAGLTCCFDPTLTDPNDPLTERIDFVLLRDRFEPVRGRIPGSIAAEIVGDEVGDRTATGLWPSDHAGVLVGVRAPRGLLGR